jgi:Domain of unknown function (DUF4148)
VPDAVNLKRVLTYTDFTDSQTGLFAALRRKEEQVMKIINSLIVAAVLAVPAVSSFAQSSNGPVTRDGVQAQLIQMQRNGATPAVNDANTYPAADQSAEARVAAQDGQTANAYGGVANTGISASGTARSDQTPGLKSVYFGS